MTEHDLPGSSIARGNGPLTVPVISLRPARTADAPVLASLAGELGYPATADEIVERLAALPRTDEVVVAEVVDGASVEVAGWIHLSVRTSLLSRPRVEVLGLIVAERWRRRSVATRLVEHARRWGRERKLDSIVLRSAIRPERDAAHAFYEQTGFAEHKRQVVFARSIADQPGD